MNQEFVKQEVAAFREKWVFGNSDDDVFAAWYLSRRYQVAPSDAVTQTADGSEGGRRNYDYGLDGFNIVQSTGERPTLVLIQAKYTDSLTAIAAGLQDLEKSLPRVSEALRCVPSEAPLENRVLVSLRRRIFELDADSRAGLKVRFEVIHLSDADELIVRTNTRRQWDELADSIAADPSLESWAPAEIALVGPSLMGGAFPPPPPPPALWHDLAVNSVPLTVTLHDRPVTMHSGIGRLTQLVDLYNERRSDLFAKNVRYFINSKQNEERGPSGKIKETLKQMCVPQRGDFGIDPELFAFHHNGVTIFARDVKQDAEGHVTDVRDPYVLNGCQTIRSAFDFRYGTRTANRIDAARWARVAVPVRVITTQDENLVRQITVSTNRQNSMTPSALRANDEVQISLERRFREAGIFYERQRGALDELLKANTARLNDYSKTNARAVNIDSLARCLAAAAGEFDHAHSPSHIFESDQAYARVFSGERTRSIRLLVVLQNLHDVLPAILKNDLGLEQQNPKAPRKTRLLYYSMCLLLRYLARDGNRDWISMYGQELLGRQSGFRSDTVRELDNYHSGIKRALKERFLSLEETKAETLRDAFRRAAWDTGLKESINVFAAFGDVD
jgi:hypothetical protein